jgi:tetratricopeptide (TPR) repeat protein
MSNESTQNAQQAAEADRYAEAVRQFGAAVALMQRGDYGRAHEALRAVAHQNADEPALAERARMYARICERRTAAPPAEPTGAEPLYLRGVTLSNDGRWDEALRLFDRAIQAQPSSGWYIYARASTYALKGNVAAAIGDLRQAIALEPATRFRAVNDPDFEQVREEPAFIDLIEPTSSGA